MHHFDGRELLRDKLNHEKEDEMYPDVINWLQRFLKERFRRHEIDVWDTHQMHLNHFVRGHGLLHYFDTLIWQTYEIRVDITGFIVGEKRKGLALVECKLDAVSLLDFCQLLGYSRVASPLLSFLVSPQGVTSALSALLLDYGRDELLEYYRAPGERPRKIVIAKWDSVAKQIEVASMIPKDFIV